MTRRIGQLLLAVAALIALYLGLASFSGPESVGCDGSGTCQIVLKSKWASIFGISVAWIGLGLYLSAIFCSFLAPKGPLPAVLLVLILGGACWFAAVQIFVLKAFCPWCSAAHLSASIGALLSLNLSSLRPDRRGFSRLAVPLCILIVGIFTQAFSSSPEMIDRKTYAKPLVEETSTLFSFHDGQVRIPKSSLPFVGEGPRNHALFFLWDPTCPFCLETLDLILAADHEQTPARVYLIPGAHSAQSKGLQRLLLTLWHRSPTAFRAVLRDLATGRVPIEFSKVIEAAAGHLNSSVADLFTEQSLRGSETSPLLAEADLLVKTHATQLDLPTLPQIILPTEIIAGLPSIDRLADLLQNAPLLAERTTALPTRPSKPLYPRPSDLSLRYATEVIDLGPLRQGTKTDLVFELENLGSDPLILRKINPPCACSSFLSKTGEIGPGESGQFSVRLDTSRLFGHIEQSVFVHTNRSKLPHEVQISADVWGPIRVLPSRVRKRASTAGFQSVLNILEDPSFETTLTGATSTLENLEVSILRDQSPPQLLVQGRNLEPGQLKGQIQILTEPANHAPPPIEVDLTIQPKNLSEK